MLNRKGLNINIHNTSLILRAPPQRMKGVIQGASTIKGNWPVQYHNVLRFTSRRPNKQWTIDLSGAR